MQQDQEDDEYGHFHTDCWETYRRVKDNKRRRLRYAFNHGVGNPNAAPPQVPGVVNPQPNGLAIPGVVNPQPNALPANNPQQVPAVVPGVDNPQPPELYSHSENDAQADDTP